MKPLEATFGPEVKKETFSKEERAFLEGKLEAMRDAQLLEDDFELTEEDGETFGKYNFGKIAEDKQRVKEWEERFAQKYKILFVQQSPENKARLEDRIKTSEYYESFFFENAGGKDGVFPEAIVYKTSKTDDLNGTDFILETKEEHLGIATDVTLVSNSNDLRDKLSHLKLDIDRGVFAEIEYFDTENQNEKLKVPRAVVAAEYESVVRTLKLWAHNEKDPAFTNNMKIKALLEIELEFDACLSYAEALNKKSHVLVFKKALETISRIKNEHADDVKRYKSKIEEDISYQTIYSWAEELKQNAQKVRGEKEAA